MSLHKETTPSKFKVGDRVFITKDSSFHNLHTGHYYVLDKKASGAFGDDCWTIMNEDGDVMYITEDDFRKVEHTPLSPDNITIITEPQKGKSDGGPSEYYDFPTDCTTLNDLIEYKGMSFAHGNIFKAAYRLGHKDGISLEYDLNKIIYYAERMLKQLKGKADGI